MHSQAFLKLLLLLLLLRTRPQVRARLWLHSAACWTKLPQPQAGMEEPQSVHGKQPDRHCRRCAGAWCMPQWEHAGEGVPHRVGREGVVAQVGGPQLGGGRCQRAWDEGEVVGQGVLGGQLPRVR